jgi:hypothetical protein
MAFIKKQWKKPLIMKGKVPERSILNEDEEEVPPVG